MKYTHNRTPQEQAIIEARSPVDITEYVRAAFDGAICDDLEELDYLVDDTERDRQQDYALRVIEAALVARYRRAITTAEAVRLKITIAFEWQQRAEKVKEQAFDRSESKLWRNVDMSRIAENY